MTQQVKIFATKSELDPQDLHGERREPMADGCLLTSTHTLGNIYAVPAHIHTQG